MTPIPQTSPAGEAFSLIDSPWIPVTGEAPASLADIFSRPHSGLGGSVLQKIALLKFLLAICQAACTPENDEEWQALGQSGLALACKSYLEKWHDHFYLHGSSPFLQYPQVASAKSKSYGVLMPEVVNDNSLVIFQTQIPPESCQVSDSTRALLLVTQMACCLGGKQTDKNLSLTPGLARGCGRYGPALGQRGYLHSFFHGSSVLETLWFNLLTREDIAQEKIWTQGVGIPPWEKMPAGEEDETARELSASLMGRLVPMARFVFLDDAVHQIDGIRHPDVLDGAADPSMTVNFSLKKARALNADPERRPWRSLTSILGFISSDSDGFVCRQLQWGSKRVRTLKGNFSIWCGGIRLTDKSGEQFATGGDDVVESELLLPAGIFDGDESPWFDRLSAEMKRMEQIATYLSGATVAYWMEFIREHKKDSAKKLCYQFAKNACSIFWQKAEREFPALSLACTDYSSAGQEQRNQILKRLAACAREAYRAICPQTTARQLAAHIRHFPRFKTIFVAKDVKNGEDDRFSLLKFC